MRFIEFLLELRELIDRTGYGSWLHAPTGKVYPTENHQAWMKANGPKITGEKFDPSDTAYKYAFRNGFVRLVHNEVNKINIEGRGIDIKRAWNILNTSLQQYEVAYAYIDAVDQDVARTFFVGHPKEITELKMMVDSWEDEDF